MGRCAKKLPSMSVIKRYYPKPLFMKVQASSAWIRTYADNHRIIARAEIGYLHTKKY